MRDYFKNQIFHSLHRYLKKILIVQAEHSY